jgi:hypothetical protein
MGAHYKEDIYTQIQTLKASWMCPDRLYQLSETFVKTFQFQITIPTIQHIVIKIKLYGWCRGWPKHAQQVRLPSLPQSPPHLILQLLAASTGFLIP